MVGACLTEDTDSSVHILPLALCRSQAAPFPLPVRNQWDNHASTFPRSASLQALLLFLEYYAQAGVSTPSDIPGRSPFLQYLQGSGSSHPCLDLAAPVL